MLNFSGQQIIDYQSPMADSSRWRKFQLRPNDIVISTPPKSGTTWTQMICALLIFRSAKLDQPLGTMSPWLDQKIQSVEQVLAQYEAQTHRRFIKTHTPFDGIPYFDYVNYIFVGRNPLDQFFSLYNHYKNSDRAAVEASLGQKLDIPFSAGPDKSFQQEIVKNTSWHHFETFWRAKTLPNVILLHYSDLKSNLAKQISKLAHFLQIDITMEICDWLSTFASFDYMKENASDLVPNSVQNFWQSDHSFFHSGQDGLGRDFLSAESIQFYDSVKKRYPLDMVQWLEYGKLTNR